MFQQKTVFGRQGERNAVALLEVADAQRVVEMAVGVDGHHRTQSVLGDEVLQRRVFAVVAVARIDDDRFVGLVPHHKLG